MSNYSLMTHMARVFPLILTISKSPNKMPHAHANVSIISPQCR